MHELKLNKDTFFLPENWNELTGKNLCDIAELYDSTTNPIDFKTKLFLRVTGLQVSKTPEHLVDEKCYFVVQKADKKYLISSEELNVIIDLFDFLFLIETDKDGNISYTIDSKLVKQLMPVVKVRTKTAILEQCFYGPADALSNLTFEEYIFTETYYHAFLKSNNMSDLNKLVAILYRIRDEKANENSPDFTGDVRIKFNSFFIDVAAKDIDLLPLPTKKAIYLFYQGCRNYIIEKFKEVFTPGKSDSSEKVSTFESMMKLVNALANNDVTKNEQVRKSMLYEVMITLKELALERKRMEELNNR